MKNKSTQLTLKSLALFVGMIGLTLFVFSCAKGGSDNNNNNNVGTVYPGCVNCNTIVNGQNFFQSQSTDIMNQFSINLSFTGSTSYNNGTSPIISYSGQVYAQGQLIITQAISTYYGCVIPAGTYTVQTTQAGQWNQAIVTGLMMQANGPVPLMVHISQAQVSARGGTGQTWNEVSPVGRLFGNISLQTLNGANCQTSTLIQ